MTTEVASAEGAAAQVNADARLYARSWVDVLTNRIDRLPGPAWLAYAIIIGLALLWANLQGWVGQTQAFWSIDPLQSSYAFVYVYPLALVHVLSVAAGHAFDAFRPATNLDDASAARTRYALTVIPARPAWALLLLGAAVNVAWKAADPIGSQIADRPALYGVLRTATECYVLGIVFVLGYFVFRQLSVVSRLHRTAVHVDVFDPAPLHAMSQLTARTSIALVPLALVGALPYPGVTDAFRVTTLIVFVLPMLIAAVAVFVVPLRGMHDRLVIEKRRLLGTANASLAAASAELHRVADEMASGVGQSSIQDRQSRADTASKTLAALLQERDFVVRRSTWPWDPNTLRAVISAVMLPVALFLLTRVLERLVL